MDPARMFEGELDRKPGIREQPGSRAADDASRPHGRSALNCGRAVAARRIGEECQLLQSSGSLQTEH